MISSDDNEIKQEDVDAEDDDDDEYEKKWKVQDDEGSREAYNQEEDSEKSE